MAAHQAPLDGAAQQAHFLPRKGCAWVVGGRSRAADLWIMEMLRGGVRVLHDALERCNLQAQRAQGG
jgi:hypothetical protein